MRGAIIALALLCAGCGTYHLQTGGTAPLGKTRDQVQLDQLACKDRALTEVNSPEILARGFALGATVIGAPVAWEMKKADTREIYTSCMEARGYRIIAGTD